MSNNDVTATPQGSIIEEQSNSFQLIRYFFDIVNDDTVSYSAQITDNWIESNSTIQDHIAISPITVTMKGLCGELVYEAKQAELDYKTELALANKRNAEDEILLSFGDWGDIVNVDGKLTAISAYAPQLSNITQKAQNMWDLHQASSQKARRISNILTGRTNKSLTSQMNSYNGLSSNARESRLKRVGEEFRKALVGRKSFTVTTPFGTFEDMFLQSVTLHQGNEDFAGDINITLKQIRYANTLTTKADEEVLSQLNALAQASEQNYGYAQSNNSMLYDMFASGAGYVNK